MSKIQITCETQDAQIYYSIDGSNPSNLYSEPFNLTTSSTVKAQATKEGYKDSDIVSQFIEITLPKLPTPVLLDVTDSGGFGLSVLATLKVEGFTDLTWENFHVKNTYLGETEFTPPIGEEVGFENLGNGEYEVRVDLISGGEYKGTYEVYISKEGYLDSDIVVCNYLINT